jgi:hypothetical protein
MQKKESTLLYFLLFSSQENSGHSNHSRRGMEEIFITLKKAKGCFEKTISIDSSFSGHTSSYFFWV